MTDEPLIAAADHLRVALEHIGRGRSLHKDVRDSVARINQLAARALTANLGGDQALLRSLLQSIAAAGKVAEAAHISAGLRFAAGRREVQAAHVAMAPETSADT